MENYIIANCTDTGKVRSVNEDSMTTFESPNGRVVAVCDGMGGQNAGDVASQLAVAVIEDILTDNTFASPEEAITRSIVAANQAILHKAAQNPALSGMGATCKGWEGILWICRRQPHLLCGRPYDKADNQGPIVCADSCGCRTDFAGGCRAS